MKHVQWVLLATAAVLAVFSPPAPAAGQPGDPAAIIAGADAIVAAEIVDTDYTATASDGPLYADAKILGIAKGTFTPGDTLKFGESAWCGPDYERKDRRLLFLQRVTSREYFRAASWSTVCRPGDRLNVFFASEALSRLSLATLQTFLGEVQAVRRTPPRRQAAVVRRERSGISGTFKVAPREIKGEDRIVLQVTHNGAYSCRSR